MSKELCLFLTVILFFSFSCEKDKTTNPDINKPPIASFTINPKSGTTDTVFNFDASGSSDTQDSIYALRVRWDWDNDGTYDTDWTTKKTASHQFSTTGTKAVKLEVENTRWWRDAEIHSLVVDYSRCGIVTDIEGNTYQTMKIGDQCWMAENLKVTHYRNGDPIPNFTENSEWIRRTTGAYCNYDNDDENVPVYGRLYNWYAVNDSRGIAPSGWHVPSDAEWQTLVDYLGGSSVAGGKMKTTGTIEGGDGLWYKPNSGATNESGFSALPGGYRYGGNGCFDLLGSLAYFWSSTEYSSSNAWSRSLHYSYSAVYRSYYLDKSDGFLLRCVRN